MIYNHKDFEDYLTDIFFKENSAILDDDAPDFYNDWLCDMGPDEWIKHGEKYAQGKLEYYKQQNKKESK